MADLSFNVGQAVEELRKDAEHYGQILKSDAARLENELRQVAAVLEKGFPSPDPISPDVVHVFDVNVAQNFPSSFELRLEAFGQILGGSTQRRRIEAGTYRAVLTLTKVG